MRQLPESVVSEIAMAAVVSNTPHFLLNRLREMDAIAVLAQDLPGDDEVVHEASAYAQQADASAAAAAMLYAIVGAASTLTRPNVIRQLAGLPGTARLPWWRELCAHAIQKQPSATTVRVTGGYFVLPGEAHQGQSMWASSAATSALPSRIVLGDGR